MSRDELSRVEISFSLDCLIMFISQTHFMGLVFWFCCRGVKWKKSYKLGTFLGEGACTLTA